MKTYIVAYVVEHDGGILIDSYSVFCDGSKKKNKKEAKQLYKTLLKDPSTYSVNICKITKTTEHYE